MASQFTDAECAILRTMINEHHAAVVPSSTAPSNCSPKVRGAVPFLRTAINTKHKPISGY